ncbi:uncharacterized protein Z519_01172 [Cladophialophora bantiana CBS 173.52]|uniref:Uncharacterized protein n=1 Tax=Cladophialophora bantiana (strain ATCC 10958 / CBS 173.52 / CDC B-1940 / NIH 8579) TaxID=1442370 RepID=A0A0D2HW68_CLAB1|nr:uncharacterized protein Z519_01172 [Cladophialophora bantiana CBS 173.52]KIW97588.1 hypothetical protein Z519_01172 [Cladophialophora bantiana CBS 173.52]
MAQVDVTFLPVLAQSSSQRERELYQAAAQSHAARLWHKWRKQRRLDARPVVASEASRSHALVTPGLISILQKGNSDPFNALAIHVTPRANQILTFFKHGYLPMVYQAVMGSEDAIRRIEALQNQGYRDGGLADEALLLKHQRIKALRQELVKNRDSQSQSLILDSVSMLFRGALIAGDLDEAGLHAGTLRKLLERKYDREGVQDLGFLLRVLYQNKQLSVFRFSLSVLDAE